MEWSNQACMGYAILAAEKVGIQEYEIEELINTMIHLFDRKTIEEAAEHYCKSDY